MLTIAAGAMFVPDRAHAVECSNGGAGPNPAGDDTGDATATACGNGASAAGNSGSAYGSNSSAGNYGAAFGVNSAATGNNSSAFGLGSSASGQSGAAFGSGSNASATDSAALGPGATATGTFSAAVATGSLASGEASVAVGRNSRASQANAAAFGAGARATATNAVAIGSSSLADVANTVSVGSSTNQRRIVNVDEGTLSATSTDAVNGSQLYQTNQLVASIADSSQYFKVDAATGSISVGINPQSSGSNAIAMGTNSVATGANSTAIGPNSSATYKNSAAFGNKAKATRANQQVFGTSSNTYTMPGLTSRRSKLAQGSPTRIVTSNANGDLAAYTPAALGLASTSDIVGLQSEIDKLGRRDRALTEGLASVASLAQPILLPGQTFAMRAGWGGYDDASAVSLTAAGLLARDLLHSGSGTLIADAGIGVGTNEGEVAGRAGVTFGW